MTYAAGEVEGSDDIPEHGHQQPGKLSLGRQRYVILMLTLASMCQFIDRSIIGIVLDPLRQEFGFSDAQLGIIAGGAFSIPFALAVLPMGALVDRVNRARLLILLLALWSVATMISGLAPGILPLLVMRAIVGVAEAGGGPASLSLLSSVIPATKRGSAIGTFLLANAGGTILTFGAAGFIVQTYGWRSAFFVAGAAGLILALIMLITLRGLDEPREAIGRADLPAGLKVLWRLAKNPTFRQIVLGSALATALMVGLWVWATSFFMRVHGISLPNAGLLVAAGAGVCAGAGNVVAGRLTDRMGNMAALRVAIWAQVAVTLSCLTIVAANSLSGAIVGFMITSFFAPMFLAPSYTVLLSLVPPQERGTALGGVQMASSVLGSALGPATVGIVSGVSGSLTTALMVLSISGPIALLLFKKAHRTIELGAGPPQSVLRPAA